MLVLLYIPFSLFKLGSLEAKSIAEAYHAHTWEIEKKGNTQKVTSLRKIELSCRILAMLYGLGFLRLR